MGEKDDIPYVIGIQSSSQIVRGTRFSITHKICHVDRIIDYIVSVDTYRYLRRKCTMSDGTDRWFNEKNDPDVRFFNLTLSTLMDFSRCMNFFRKLGLTGGAQFIFLSYGDTRLRSYGDNWFDNLVKRAEGTSHIPHVAKTTIRQGKPYEDHIFHEKPFVFGDLTPEFIANINKEDEISLRLEGEEGTDTEGVVLFYEQEKGYSHPKDPRVREISYFDVKITQPRFNQILEVAPFNLNTKEKELLEEIIEKSL